MLYALRGPLSGYVGRFAVREYRDSHDGIRRRVGPANGLYGGFSFWDMFRPAGHGRKNSRLLAIGGHASGGKLLGSIGTRADALYSLEGMKKPAPGCPRAGAGDIQDFFAVSQMIIKGSIRTNKRIKRCTPSRWGAPRRASSRAGKRCASGLSHRSAPRPLAGIA